MSRDDLSRLKAPRTHGELLAHPPLDQVGSLLRVNRERLSFPITILTRPLGELRALARTEALSAAKAYLHEAGEPVPDWVAENWLVSGHQPEFFHPGVWAKNFILQALARKHQAIPLNLVVDNDTAKVAHLRVPMGDWVVNVPFDSWQSEIPFEERPVQDESLFRSLPDRVAELTHAWPFRPWLSDLREMMSAIAPTTNLLGERIVRVRRSMERSIGLAPLEVPLSAVCQSEAFAWFSCGLLAEITRFHSVYNGAIGKYRHRHGLKSKNHPAPDLEQLGGLWEAPFWIWRTGQQRRHRLFVSPTDNRLTLFAEREEIAHLSGRPIDWVSSWKDLEKQGIKIRTRALTTTLFCRLLLADLFLHGLGGGKYDEVTDDILRGFFSPASLSLSHNAFEPPAYLVATATLLLPLPRHPDAATEHERSQRTLRDLWWNPQRHLKPLPSEASIKHDALAWPTESHQQRVDRFRALLRGTEQLRPFVDDQLKAGRRRLVEVDHLRRQHDIAVSRDYGWCLYPEEMLRSFFRERMIPN